jgi:ribosomal protein S12 methylthiotransferase
VPAELKRERLERFMELAAAISARRLAAKIGRTMRVLVDRIDDGVAIARSSADAPEIDGVVRIRGANNLKMGDWAEVRITKAGAYDLEARLHAPGKSNTPAKLNTASKLNT